MVSASAEFIRQQKITPRNLMNIHHRGTDPPASPERLAMAGRDHREKIHHGGTRIYTEKILSRITKTRRHERKYLLIDGLESLKVPRQ
jgi:hypothetical protein